MDKEQAIEKLNDIRCHVKETSTEEQALVMAINALKAQLSQEGTTSDLISRQVAIDVIEDYPHGNVWNVESMKEMVDKIKALPPAQPETPCYLGSPCEYQNRGVVISQPELAAGEWIVHLYKVGVNRYECSTCHTRCDIMYPYCPYCGEKKEGERYAIN